MSLPRFNSPVFAGSASPTRVSPDLILQYLLIQLLLHLSPDLILQYLLVGLQQPQLSSIAANALQNISTQCRDHMTSHFQGLMHIVKSMETFSLSTDAAVGLLKGKLLIMCCCCVILC